MARRNCSARSRDDYFQTLCRVFAHLPADAMTSDLTPDVLRDCLDEWSDCQPNTRYKVDAMFRAFCKWLYLNEYVDRNPLDRLPRPQRVRPEDMPLRSVTGDQVRRLFD